MLSFYVLFLYNAVVKIDQGDYFYTKDSSHSNHSVTFITKGLIQN